LAVVKAAACVGGSFVVAQLIRALERRYLTVPVCNVSLQVIPLLPDHNSYPVIDRVISMIDATGVKYVVGPMETTMEGELRELLGIVEKAHAICVEAGANRIISNVKIDYNTEGVTIESKIGKYR